MNVRCDVTTNGHKSWFVAVWKDGRRVDTRVCRSAVKAEKLSRELREFWSVDPHSTAANRGDEHG